ncbi:hypothetical protein ACGFI4_04930 [Micromonospora carbonacea]|uniref:hypothetical protein n=1 Tax=Micromonospora carbonacea TaxID=47853 RepID=UPI003715892D
MAELHRMYEDASYSAQIYFEAAKSAEFWGKAIVFLPALASSAASILVALGESRQWGAVGAVAGAVAATSAFLGSDRRAKSLRESGNRFTALRHTVRLESATSGDRAKEELEQIVRSLRAEYNSIVSDNELVSNRFFKKADSRISSGSLSYEVDEKADIRETS